MRIGAYQFAISGDVNENYKEIEKAIYLAKHKDISKRKYYNIEIKCSRNYNFNSKYFEAITRTRQLLEECIDFSDHLNI